MLIIFTCIFIYVHVRVDVIIQHITSHALIKKLLSYFFMAINELIKITNIYFFKAMDELIKVNNIYCGHIRVHDVGRHISP